MVNIRIAARREYSDRMIVVIFVLHAKDYNTREISTKNNIPKSIINTIIRRAINSLDK